jgi:ABC-type glutathione transport system ATPase component
MSAPPPALLEAHDLHKTYARGSWIDGDRTSVRAIEAIDFHLEIGEIVAIVGPSGSGKSTLARCLAFLEFADRGELRLDGCIVDMGDARALRHARRQVQLVFQDPARAVPRRFTLARALEEPGTIAGLPADERRRRARDLLDEIGLDTSFLERRIETLSGGQLQRLALARALATDPRVLILDETFTGLDLSSRARMIDLLIRLMERRRLGYVLISHDPALVAHFADRALLMQDGRVVDRVDRAGLRHVRAEPR